MGVDDSRDLTRRVALLTAGSKAEFTILRDGRKESLTTTISTRNEKTASARSYYCKLPSLDSKKVLILVPMLATGGSSVQAIEAVNAHGAALKDLSLVCIVCAPEGVRAVEALDPEIDIYAAVLDRELNALKYILPGLGDFGDRLYGT